MIDEVTIMTRPPGFFSEGEYRTFKADKVTVKYNFNNRHCSASCCSYWDPGDTVVIDTTGEVVRGMILEGGYYD